MHKLIEILNKEPDILSAVIESLSEDDLCQFELVCHSFRNIVKQTSSWKKKLNCNYCRDLKWRVLLNQNKWDPNLGFDHKENKMLFLKIKSLLGPDGMPDGILYYTMNDIDLSLKTSDVYIPQADNNYEDYINKNEMLTQEERAFLTRRQKDHLTLISSMSIPIHPMDLKKQKLDYINYHPSWSVMCHPRTRTPTFILSQSVNMFSNLILFSPTAFPIMVTRGGFVAVAGARYGKGKIVVCSNESLLESKSILEGAINWCSNSMCSPKICVDSTTKEWSEGNSCWEYVNKDDSKQSQFAKFHKFPMTYMSRDMFL